MKAFLILEDGTVFEGTHIGADREIISEIVFNTSMAGYLEVLTDPSYAGQAVCMTYPLIGNYGVCREDMESRRPWPDGFIVRELSRIPSNFRCDMTIQQFLEENEVPGIAGIDTRALTKLLREKGTMNGMITTDENYHIDEILPKLRAYTTGKVVERVTCTERYEVKGSRDLKENGPISGSAVYTGEKEKKPTLVRELNGKGKRVALLDLGTKYNIADSLAKRGIDVTVYPALTKAEEILSDGPDGIMLSNGPGDPKECTGIIDEIRKLYESDVPIFAICLGHQLMALATGADTYKLKYGHRGGNHPVKDLQTGNVYISSQNHGYVVDMDRLDPDIAVPAFVNANDGTCEGLKNVVIIMIMPYDPFGLNRMVYTIKSRCTEVAEMPYEDGASTLFLYTKGTEGIPNEALKQLLHYMEHTTEANAISAELQDIQEMVRAVKKDPEVTAGYMLRQLRMMEELNRMRKEVKEEVREEVREEVKEEVELYNRISLVCKKLRKGRTLEEIAEDLEEELSVIEPLYNKAKEFAPDYDPNLVFEMMSKDDEYLQTKTD